MNVVREVTAELWQFVLDELRVPSRAQESPSVVPTPGTVRTVADIEADKKQLAPSNPILLPDSVQLPRPSEPDTARDEAYVATHSALYIAYPDTPCYLRPAMVLDTIIGSFAYATKVSVVSRRDDWVHVHTPHLEGWVERFALTSHMHDVLPEFETGVVYDAEHPETIKLRTYIDDEFNARIMRAPVLNCEYVWFRLCRAGRPFSWPVIRPRTAGRWREILRTEPTVHVSSVPLTGSVMEYTDGSGVGHLYYVESVTPEEGVVVSGFTASDSGEYEHRSFTAAAQRTLKAAFLCKT